jgi:hypothetical protein
VSNWDPVGIDVGDAFRSYVTSLRETASFGTEPGFSADNETPETAMSTTSDSYDEPTPDLDTAPDDERVERTKRQMGRRSFMAAAGATALVATGAGAVSAQSDQLNFSTEMTPDPRIRGTVTVGEVGPDMAMLEYIADDDTVQSLADYGGMLAPRPTEGEPHNPVQVSAGAIGLDAYGAFPREEQYDEDGDGSADTDVSALDATHWTKDVSGSAGTMTIADDQSAGGVNGLRVSTSSQGTGDVAIAALDPSYIDFTEDIDRRYIQLGVDVDTLESAATVDIVLRDSNSNEVVVSIDDGLTLDDTDVVATSTGDAVVYQQQIGDINADTLTDIQAYEVQVSEGNADVLFFWQDLERTTDIAFGTEEYLDADDNVDTQTLYEPSGSYSITELGTVDDLLAGGTFLDVTYDIHLAASEASTDWHEFQFVEADRYDRDLRYQVVYNHDPPAAFDLNWSLDELFVEQSHPSNRYISVKTATGSEQFVLDDRDSDTVSWTSRTGNFDKEIGDEVSMTTVVNAGDVTGIYFDVLVDEGEKDDMTGSAAVGGPTGQSGGFLDKILSVPGMILTAVIGGLGLRRVFGG